MAVIPAPTYVARAAWVPTLVIWHADGRFTRLEGAPCENDAAALAMSWRLRTTKSRREPTSRWASGFRRMLTSPCLAGLLYPDAETPLVYCPLVGAMEVGRVRTAEDALTVLRQASQPLGPMGAEWLQRQERGLEGGR